MLRQTQAIIHKNNVDIVLVDDCLCLPEHTCMAPVLLLEQNPDIESTFSPMR